MHLIVSLFLFVSFSVHAGQKPIAKMTVSPETGFLPLLVSFDGSQSSDPEGGALTYEWSFGDGATATGVQVSHVYKTNRVENAKLTVTDVEGKKSVEHFIFKFSKDRTPPSLSFDMPENFQSLISTPIITAHYSDETSKVNTSKVSFVLDGLDVTSNASIENSHAVLQFTPSWPLTPGLHSLVVKISDYYDNVTSKTLHFSFFETDSQTAFLSGKILDVDGAPISGVTSVSVEGPVGPSIRAVSDSNGNFSIPFSIGGDYKIEFTKSGHLPIYKFVSLIQGIGENLGTVTMAESDPKVTFIGTSGGTATNSTNTISIDVPAGSIPSGLNFAFTEAVTGKTLQIPLPNGSQFTYAHNAQPAGTQFSTPADMWIRNLLGFAPGTGVPIGVTNDAIGVWADSGYRGVVSEDGERINFKVAHFSDYDLNFPTAQKPPFDPEHQPPDPVANNDPGNPCPCPGTTVPASRISLSSGNVSVDYELPPVIRRGVNIAKTFTYSSATVNPWLIVSSVSKARFNAKLPVNVKVETRFTDKYLEKEYDSYSGIKDSSFHSLVQTIKPNGERLSTGAYPFEMRVSSRFDDRVYANAPYFGGPADPSQSTSVETREPVYLTEYTNSYAVINNQTASRFGAGWNISGYERVFEDPETKIVTLTKGNESSTYYLPIDPGSGKVVYQKRASGETSNLHYHKGFIYGADCSSDEVFKIDAAGRYTTIAGGSTDKLLSLKCPKSIFPSRKGGYYIADSGNGRVIYLKPDGTHKVLAGQGRGEATSPSFVTEDNVLAVHFVDGDEIKTISPHDGKVLTMVGDSSEAFFNYKLKSPSQIQYDDMFNLVVLDKGLNKVIKFYINGGTSRVLLDDLKGPKELAFDSIRKNFYLLTDEGNIHFWHGWGNKTTLLLDSSGPLLKVFDSSKSNKKSFRKFNSIAFSPMTGLVLAGDDGLRMRAIQNLSKSSVSSQEYVRYATDSSNLFKSADGKFQHIYPNHVQYTFDANGLLERFHDRGTEVSEDYIHDSDGKLISINFSHGRGSYSFQYGSSGKLISVTDPALRVTQFNISSVNQLESIIGQDGLSKRFHYGASNLMTQRFDEDDEPTKYEYILGRVTKVTKNGFREFKFADTILNQVISLQQPGQMNSVAPLKVRNTFISPEGRETSDILDNFGLFSGKVDGDENISYTSRNRFGRPIGVVSPEGRETTQSFDDNGNILSKIDGDGIYRYFWSPSGKLLKTTDAFNNSYTNTYGANDLVETVTNPRAGVTIYSYDSDQNLSQVQDPLENITKFFYNSSGNLSASVDPLGVKTSMERDVAGHLISLTDGLNNQTTFEYDLQGRMTKSVDAKNKSTQLTYSSTGEIIEVIDANNRATEFEYNSFRKVIKVTNPNNQSTHYSYDEDGNVLSKTTKLNELINYEYDRNNRLTEKSIPGDTFTFRYDRDGKLVSAVNTDSELKLGYDRLGRNNSDSSSHFNGRVEHQYDVRGDKISTILYLGNQVAVSIDRSFGSLREIYNRTFWVAGAEGKIQSTTDVMGRLILDVLPNGIERTIDYDALSRPKKIGFSGAPFTSSLNYSYNAVGSIVGITEQTANTSKELRYDYDELQRLVFEDSIVRKSSFELDPVGNLISSGFMHNSLNQVLESPDYTYEYDLNGNRTRKTVRMTGERFDYNWSPENQLEDIKIFKGGQHVKTIGYKYDATGRRIERVVSDLVTPSKSYHRKYVYDGQQILAILDGNNNLLSAYIHGDGIDNPLAMVTDYDKDGDLDVLTFLNDHLGSVKFITNAQRQIVEEIHYSAYGETQIKRRGNTPTQVVNHFYYTGREIEPETGDYYYRARSYDPYSQKFLSEDPIGLRGGFNLYLYVRNNPLKYRDPTGLLTESEENCLNNNAEDYYDEFQSSQGDSAGTQTCEKKHAEVIKACGNVGRMESGIPITPEEEKELTYE